MGCGTSLNDSDTKSPKKNVQIIQQTTSTHVILSGPTIPVQTKNFDIRQIKTQKSIQQTEKNQPISIKQQQQPEQKVTNARIFLFGQSKQERKIIQFEAAPSPHIQILLSRTNNPPPVKYQPQQIILQESQELTSSHMYLSTSHPPYNYMLATFIKYNTIFLCGGVNFSFENLSNEAFLFSAGKEEQSNVNTPQKSEKGLTLHKKRSVGNNLMGSKFQRLPYMKTKRYSHMGVYYKAGKLGYVYVFGGRNQNDETLNLCEKYSVSENKWTQIAPMNSPRSTGFSLIVNKKIYVFGGYTSQGKRSKKIQRYNPTFDNWEVLNIKIHKGIETGLLLPCPASNQILIVGGNVEFGAIKTVLRMNFENETYVWDSDLKKQRLLQKGISLLQQNSAYVLGGDFEDTVQKYSYKDKTWKIVNNLNYGSCVSPEDINAFTLAQETIQLSFESVAMKQAKQNQSNNFGGSIVIFGSDDYPCVFELSTSKWVLKKKPVPMALRLRSFMTSAKIKQGKIFIAGGIDAYFQKASRAAYIYYPGTNKAIQISKMKQKKYGFAACVYNGIVYIFGGQTGKQGNVLTTVQKYDIDLGQWSQLPEMPRQRTFCKAVLSPNNKICLIGGSDCLYQGVTEIDMFDPETETFSTLDASFPLACEIKHISFGNKTIQKQVHEQFQFLDQIQNKQPEKVQIKNINEQYLLVFGYNSYRKEDQAYILSFSSKQSITLVEPSYKIYPYSLSFSAKSSPPPAQQPNSESKNDNQILQNIYYFISSKGFFKWQQSTKKMDTQIVINQMHLLQMPLQKFSVS